MGIPISRDELPEMVRLIEAATGKKPKVYRVLWATETRAEALALARAAAKVTNWPRIAEVVKTPSRPERVDGVRCLYAVQTESLTLGKSPELLNQIRAMVAPPRHVKWRLFREAAEDAATDAAIKVLLGVIAALRWIVDRKNK